MRTKTFVTAALTVVPRCRTALKSLNPVAVISVTLVIVLGGMGIADAATGGNFLLGRANTESSKATLSNSRGTPLSLVAPKNTAPLSVNRRTMVPNLNAQFVGGLNSSALKSTGGDGFANPASNIPLPHTTATKVASTGPLPAGIYYVTATAEVSLGAGTPGAECFITIDNDVSHEVQEGGENGGGVISAAETAAVSLKNKDTLQEWCQVQSDQDHSVAMDSAITAIRVLSSSGTKPATPQAAGRSKDAK